MGGGRAVPDVDDDDDATRGSAEDIIMWQKPRAGCCCCCRLLALLSQSHHHSGVWRVPVPDTYQVSQLTSTLALLCLRTSTSPLLGFAVIFHLQRLQPSTVQVQRLTHRKVENLPELRNLFLLYARLRCNLQGLQGTQIFSAECGQGEATSTVHFYSVLKWRI